MICDHLEWPVHPVIERNMICSSFDNCMVSFYECLFTGVGFWLPFSEFEVVVLKCLKIAPPKLHSGSLLPCWCSIYLGHGKYWGFFCPHYCSGLFSHSGCRNSGSYAWGGPCDCDDYFDSGGTNFASRFNQENLGRGTIISLGWGFPEMDFFAEGDVSPFIKMSNIFSSRLPCTPDEVTAIILTSDLSFV